MAYYLKTFLADTVCAYFIWAAISGSFYLDPALNSASDWAIFAAFALAWFLVWALIWHLVGRLMADRRFQKRIVEANRLRNKRP